MYNADGEFLFKFGSHGEGNGQFNAPTGVAVDANGNIIVADWGNSRIQVGLYEIHLTWSLRIIKLVLIKIIKTVGSLMLLSKPALYSGIKVLSLEDSNHSFHALTIEK